MYDKIDTAIRELIKVGAPDNIIDELTELRKQARFNQCSEYDVATYITRYVSDTSSILEGSWQYVLVDKLMGFARHKENGESI